MPRATDGFARAGNFDKRKAADLRADRLIKPSPKRFAVPALEVKFQAELELARIKCRGRLAVVPAAA
jgi:hypothetical protein